MLKETQKHPVVKAMGKESAVPFTSSNFNMS